MAARWSAEEDRILRRLYAEQRPIQEIAARVGRSSDAVAARRSSLGVAARPRSRPWSAQEEKLLHVAIVGGVPVSAIAARLDRSRDQVRARSRSLVARRAPAQPYLSHEDDAIRRCVLEDGNLAALASLLGRSSDALRIHAQQLGLHRPAPRRRWEEWEDAAVRDGYTSALSCAEIARQLGSRTPGSVAARARKLGLSTYARRWSVGEDHHLTRMSVLGVSLEQAALQLGRTPEAVRRHASRRAIEVPSTMKPSRATRRWTPEEDELLRLHSALNPARLAQLLGRSDHAVCRRLCSLGLRQRAARSPHHTISRPQGRLTPGEREMLERERGGTTRRRAAALRRLDYLPGRLVLRTDHAFVIGDGATGPGIGAEQGVVR